MDDALAFPEIVDLIVRFSDLRDCKPLSPVWRGSARRTYYALGGETLCGLCLDDLPEFGGRCQCAAAAAAEAAAAAAAEP